MIASEDESKRDFLARLDRRDNVSLQPSGVVTQQASPMASTLSVQPVAGPSQQSNGDSEEQVPITSEMFAMLCDQITILADTQTRERDRIEQENRDNMAAVQATIARMAFSQDASSSTGAQHQVNNHRISLRFPYHPTRLKQSTSQPATLRRLSGGS